MDIETTYTAFAGVRRLARGSLAEVTAKVRAALKDGADGVIVLADDSGRTIDLDPRAQAPLTAAASDLAPPIAAKPLRGRPKLGVTAREVTLLPRHWEWLGAQPGGASAALRRLVDQARRDGLAGDRLRESREAAHRAMTTLAGDLPGYEEALRALYSGDRASFARSLAEWPPDVRTYVEGLADRLDA